eukprot:2638519-Rhodomonas_salina.1
MDHLQQTWTTRNRHGGGDHLQQTWTTRNRHDARPAPAASGTLLRRTPAPRQRTSTQLTARARQRQRQRQRQSHPLNSQHVPMCAL